MGYRVGAAHRLAEAHRLLSARFLLALLEECGSGAGNDHAAHDPAHLAHHRAPADLLDHTLRDRRCPNAPHSSEQHSHAVSATAVGMASAASASQASGHFGQNQPSDQQQQKVDMHVNTRETSARRLASKKPPSQTPPNVSHACAHLPTDSATAGLSLQA